MRVFAASTWLVNAQRPLNDNEANRQFLVMMCGLGRMGQGFGADHYEAEPPIVGHP
jgi:adenosylmethionine-8-amino-7-oxononanoate aminotransferase